MTFSVSSLFFGLAVLLTVALKWSSNFTLQLIQSLATVGVFMSACLGWGRLFRKSQSPLESWILGLGFLGGLGFIAGFAGFLNPKFCLIVMILGSVLFVRKRPDSGRIQLSFFWGLIILFVSIPVIWMMVKPNFGVDQLYYHLPSIKKYLEHGSFRLIPEIPFAVHSGVMELYFGYLYPLAPSTLHWHLSTQFCHFLLGSVLGCFLIFRLGTLDQRPRWIGYLAVLGFAAMGFEKSFSVVSKNDFFLMSMTLGGLYYGFVRNWKLMVICCGLAANTKYFGLMSAGLTYFVFLPDLWKSRMLGKVTLGLAVVCVPVYLRNFLLTHNPVFPLFNHIFQSPFWNKRMDETLHILANQGGENLTARHWANFMELLKKNYLAFLFPLVLWKASKSTLQMLLFVVIFMAAWRFVAGGWFETQNRYIYFNLALLSIMGAIGVSHIPKLGPLLGIALTLAGSRIDVRYREMEPYPLEASLVEFATHRHAEFQVQEYLNSISAKSVLSLYRPERLYLDGQLYTPAEMPYLVDLRCDQGKTGAELWQMLRELKIEYFYHALDNEPSLKETFSCLWVESKFYDFVGNFGTQKLYLLK